MSLTEGQYYPRIGRGPWGYRGSPYYEVIVSARLQLTLLHEDLNKIFSYVQPSDIQQSVYGHELRNLLVLAATEFEAQCVGVLKANNISPSNGRSFNTVDFVKLNQAMKLNEYVFKLTMHPSYSEIKPFLNWDVDAPTQSLSWYDAYNKTKHDREENFSFATLNNAINSVAGVTAMYIAQVLGTDANSPTLQLPRTFGVTKWGEPDEHYIQPRDRVTWTPVHYQF